MAGIFGRGTWIRARRLIGRAVLSARPCVAQGVTAHRNRLPAFGAVELSTALSGRRSKTLRSAFGYRALEQHHLLTELDLPKDNRDFIDGLVGRRDDH